MQDCGIRKYYPICHTEYGLLLYRRERLFLMDEQSNTLSFLCAIPIEDPRRALCIGPLTERVMHISVYCGYEAPGGAVIAFNKGIYYVDIPAKRIHREHDFSAPGMRRPLLFCKVTGVRSFPDGLYFGDYFYNVQQLPASIYRRSSKGTWEKVYTFPAGTIRHIHSINADPYRNRVIICTGDNGEEAAIWAAYDNFTHVEKIFGGDQVYRACCAKAYPEGVLLVTDSPHFQNYAYLLKENDGAVQIEFVSKLPGPVVFFTTLDDDVIVATDVEFDERKLNRFTAYFTYHRGAGVQDWYSHVLVGNPKDGFRELYRAKKDLLPMGRVFGFGGIAFPSGNWKRRIYLCPYAVQKRGQLFYIDLPTQINK